MINSKFLTYHPEIPPIPLDIQNSIKEIVEGGENIFTFSKYTNYKVYKPTDKVTNWIDSHFKWPHRQKIYTIESMLPTHIDIDCTYSFNFIIDTGGPDVHTRWFESVKENAEIIEDHVISAGVWHRLDVTSAHGVFNIPSDGKRIAITVGDIAKINREALRHQSEINKRAISDSLSF
jgi:hypothetical protein